MDVFGQRTDDPVLLEYAAEKGRVLVTTDMGLEAIAIRWLREWRAFPGLIIWAQRHQRVMSEGDLLREFEELSTKANAFAYPVHHITPRR